MEEVVKLDPLKGMTTGQDVLNGFLRTATKMNLDICKLIFVTTIGAPAMEGRIKGFVSLLVCHLRNNGINHSLLKFHCIIHQEALCAKSVTFNDMMKVVVKAVHLILPRGLNNIQPLDKTEAQYSEQLYCCDVLMSHGATLEMGF